MEKYQIFPLFASIKEFPRRRLLFHYFSKRSKTPDESKTGVYYYQCRNVPLKRMRGIIDSQKCTTGKKMNRVQTCSRSVFIFIFSDSALTDNLQNLYFKFGLKKKKLFLFLNNSKPTFFNGFVYHTLRFFKISDFFLLLLYFLLRVIFFPPSQKKIFR